MDLPSNDDRLSILQLLCKDLSEYIEHSQGIDNLVEQVATLTPGYSAADLRAVVSEAFMISARKALRSTTSSSTTTTTTSANGTMDARGMGLGNLTTGNQTTTDEQERLHVSLTEMLEAIQAQGPSIHGQDLVEYQQEYATFGTKKSGGGKGNASDAAGGGKQRKRVILA